MSHYTGKEEISIKLEALIKLLLKIQNNVKIKTSMILKV